MLDVSPINPDFLSYQAQREAKILPLATQDGNWFGCIPAPHRLTVPVPGNTEQGGPTLAAFASSYDLRSLGRVTSVKNQNPWGTCWTFGTYGSMESCRLPDETLDFSEKNLANLHGFDPGYNDGGHGYMSTAYLCRWDGPINETDDPYPTGSWSSSAAGLTVRKHVQDVWIIPGKSSATDNNALKQALTDYGAVMASYHHDSSYYSSANHTYYCNASVTLNHAVTLVGWDDNFDRTLFPTTAPADGAYIVKNSWGTGWGESGYFYVSYYDSVFAWSDSFVFLNAEATNQHHTVYQYDPLGWVSSLNPPWAAAIYTATASEPLDAIGFYSDTGATNYTLYVYTGVTAGAPRTGTLQCSMTGSVPHTGFNTVALTTTAPLTSGQRFSIVLYLSGGSSYPQAVEYAYGGYASAASASAGQTFYSFNGSEWSDLTTYDSTANFCLKGYTEGDTTPVTNTLTIASAYGGAEPPDGVHTYAQGSSMSCSVTNSPLMVLEATRASQLVCTGWVGTGSAPETGSTTNTGTFDLNTDSSVTWLWAVSNLWLSNQTVSATVTEEALGTITAGDGYTVDPGADVTHSAGAEVRLTPGFHADTGSLFRAHITTD